jgi:hypothetical protein
MNSFSSTIVPGRLHRSHFFGLEIESIERQELISQSKAVSFLNPVTGKKKSCPNSSDLYSKIPPEDL